jgi:hypothetical protein
MLCSRLSRLEQMILSPYNMFDGAENLGGKILTLIKECMHLRPFQSRFKRVTLNGSQVGSRVSLTFVFVSFAHE